MKNFMNRDFLLKTETAKALYHGHAEKMPVLDYHCHINPMEIYEDKKYDTITEVWLGGDHYKWRVMRASGVPERYITGDASPAEKFQKWGETMPKLIGNPLYHWTHLELQRYFGITEPLNGDNAMEIFEKCNEQLQGLSVREIIRRSNVKLICTTDDPADDLKAHELLAARTDYPLHVGITEAGTVWSGNIKSSIGLGLILHQGIGDTLRVSLSGDPVEEIRSAKLILRTLGLRGGGIEVVSCPTCGRTRIDLIGLAARVERLAADYPLDIKVAVMGCAVNGPGEAREADLGIAGGEKEGLLFKKGQILRKVPEDQLLQALQKELDNWK